MRKVSFFLVAASCSLLLCAVIFWDSRFLLFTAQMIAILNAIGVGIFILSLLEPLEDREEAIAALPPTSFEAVGLRRLREEWDYFAKALAVVVFSYLAVLVVSAFYSVLGGFLGTLLAAGALFFFATFAQRVRRLQRSIAPASA